MKEEAPFKPWKDYVKEKKKKKKKEKEKKTQLETDSCLTLEECDGKLQDNWLSSTYTLQDLFTAEVSLSEMFIKKAIINISACHLIHTTQQHRIGCQSGKKKT